MPDFGQMPCFEEAQATFVVGFTKVVYEGLRTDDFSAAAEPRQWSTSPRPATVAAARLPHHREPWFEARRFTPSTSP